MSLVPVTESVLRAKVEAVRRKAPRDRFIGIRLDAPWRGPDRIQLRDETFEVVWCPSSLAVRERLAMEGAEGLPCVILTDRPDADLGKDVIARFALGRIATIQVWSVVLERFQARTCDPRLTRASWMAEAMLGVAAESPDLPPAPGAFLDEETAWRAVLGSLLHLHEARPDPEALLRWTLDPANLTSWTGLAPEVREGIAGHLAEASGVAARGIVGALRASRGGDALALGVVCGVLLGAPATDIALVQALVRLEAWVGGMALSPDERQAWARASAAVLGAIDGDAQRRTRDRAQALLGELRADELAARSDELPASWQARIRAWAESLGALARDISPTALRRVDDAWAALRRHVLWKADPTRIERFTMARRLAHALVDQNAPTEGTPASFNDATVHYADALAWLDRAREALIDGDEDGTVATAMRDLWSCATTQRESFNRAFARRLADWTEVGGSGGVIGVEHLLDEVVAPAAGRAPVLLLVLDGMSLPVYLALREDLATSGWVETSADDRAARRCAVAMLPTETTVSRTSLLCGAPRVGGASEEKNGFAQHTALRAAGRGTRPPALFHKAELGGGQVGLADDVRRAIQEPEQRVVGVVVNAIDDHLTKGDQIAAPHTIDAIRPLALLLAAARDAGRCVILTADHGHVLDRDLAQRRADTDHARHRLPGKPVTDEEVLLRGPRVLVPGGAICALWSERVRYGRKQSGYHGGASPQEVLVPVGVFVSSDQLTAAGPWRELLVPPPRWWNPDRDAAPVAAAPALPPVTPVVAPLRGAQGELFVARPAPAVVTWLDALLQSPVLADRRRQNTRLAVPDERIRDILGALDRSGSSLRFNALALQLDLPLVRLRSILVALRTLLNVDAYPVLTLDEVSETVRLDRALLDKQFELPSPANGAEVRS